MRRIFALLIALLLLPSLSPAASPEAIGSLTAKLERWEAEEAWREVQGLLSREPDDPKLLELAGRAAFYRGHYPEALKYLNSALEKGGGEEKRKGFALLTEMTARVVAPFQRTESPHFVILLDGKQDGILAAYLVDTLERTYRVMAERYGFDSREKIRVEVFPDPQAFYEASTLSARDIEVAGAVGLAKFNKLQLLSPRALAYGYRWLDAISHEYMHYLIVKMTANQAPIWFHEGLAKYEEARWRSGPSYLSPLYQTLLARALDSGKLIPFERMEPSLVRLETPEEVQLAYGQAASAIDFIVQRAGTGALRAIMGLMADGSGKGAAGALQEVLGLGFAEFESQWKEHLASRSLKPAPGVNVRPFRVREGKGAEERMDMEEIKSLLARNRAHLGDRLKERGRMSASVLEYRRALAEAPDSVPILNRLSSALLGLDRNAEALESLGRARTISPDHPTPHTDLGRAYLRLRKFQEAREAFEASIQINPFNPEAHRGLAAAAEELGDHGTAAKEREIAKGLENQR